MFNVGQYRSTEKGNNSFLLKVSENIIFSNLNLNEISLSILDHFQAIKKL